MAQLSNTFTSSSSYIRDSCTHFFPTAPSQGDSHALLRPPHLHGGYGIPENATTDVAEVPAAATAGTRR